MLFVGIDCGRLGAVGALSLEGAIVRVRDMPLTDDDELDFDMMGDIFDELLTLDSCLDVTIEKVQPMPHRENGVPVGHGMIAAFKLGASYGSWMREVASKGIRPNLYPPATWKAQILGGLPKGKQAAVDQAVRIFRCSPDLFKTKRGRLLDGRAESLLLAELGRRTWRLTHGMR